MKTFKQNQTYTVRSIGDHDCIWNFTVEKRTDKFIYIMVNNVLKRVGIKVYDGGEIAFPFGKYSMCPIIRAT